MAKNPQSKDEALEALDFIVNVLKEHEKELDKLINELATVAEQIGDTDEVQGKVEKIEERISNLQRDVANIASIVSETPRMAPPVAQKENKVETSTVLSISGQSVVLRCKQWDDFQSLAAGAQTVSFTYKEDEKVFQADALKGSQIVTFSGPLPTFSAVLKTWLSTQLNTPERAILEGILAAR